MIFTIDNDQQIKLSKWMADKNLDEYTGAIGGRFTYCFTNTSLGEILVVKDNLDNTEIDLTDYEGF